MKALYDAARGWAIFVKGERVGVKDSAGCVILPTSYNHMEISI